MEQNSIVVKNVTKKFDLNEKLNSSCGLSQ